MAGIRPKEYFLSYDMDNPGILNQTKSRHYKTLQRNMVSKSVSQLDPYPQIYPESHQRELAPIQEMPSVFKETDQVAFVPYHEE